MHAAAKWGAVLALVTTGSTVFFVAVLFTDVHVGGAHQFARGGYCSVAGNTAVDGSPLPPGTFLNLAVGEPKTDDHYSGATPADFVRGSGLTCGVPAGYVRRGFVSDAGQVGGIYPYYVPESG